MRRPNAPYAVFAVLLIAGMAIPAAAAVASAAPAQALTPVSTASITTYTSTNWAGYGAVGSATDTVTAVSASWIEPTLTCKSATSIAVFWVGIDGMVSSAPSVEQTGTIGECVGGVASYGAWWEVYPVNSIQVISSITVTPGDHFTASVTYSSATSKFAMKITDTTTGATFTKKMAYSSAARETAECIAERPSGSSGLYPLANFGKATFTDCKATISGTSAGIGTFATVYEITMATTVHSLAVPGALKSSTTFTVTWKHST
jgi:Peptidase A4 family